MDATKQPNGGDTNANKTPKDAAAIRFVDPKMYQMLSNQFGLNMQMINAIAATALGQDKATEIILELLNQHNASAQQGRFMFVPYQAVADQSAAQHNGKTVASNIEKVANAAPMAANVQLMAPTAADTEYMDGGEPASAPATGDQKQVRLELDGMAQPPTVADLMHIIAPAAHNETTPQPPPQRTGALSPPKRRKLTEASDADADAQPQTVEQEPVPARRNTDKATAVAAKTIEAPHRTALAERNDNGLHLYSQPADLPVARQRAAKKKKKLASRKTKAANAASLTSPTPESPSTADPTASRSRPLAVTLAQQVLSLAAAEALAATANYRSGESDLTTATAEKSQTATTTTQAPKPSMKSSVTLTGMRAELLRRHFDLRRIETELMKLPKPIDPANCNVPECMRLLDEFDRFQVTRRCLQLHPAIVSVLIRLLKMGKQTSKDPALLALQQRISNKLQSFMDICDYPLKGGLQFRVMVVQHQMLLQKTPPELHYLAVTAQQFQRLHIIARMPGVPLEWATAAHRQCFERCQRMSGWTEFDRRTNVRRRIAIEVQRAAELNQQNRAAAAVEGAAATCVPSPPAPAEESTDASIETIFRTYVPMWQAWHCTLLQFVRLRAILPEVDERNDMNDAAVHVKSEPTETPPRNDNVNVTADGDDNEVVEVPTPATPEIIELESVNDTQQRIEQLITPALDDVSSTTPALMTLQSSETTGKTTADESPAEAEAPADVQESLTAAATSSTAPVDGPTAAVTGDRPSEPPLLPSYLKMTPITHAAFDLSPSDDDPTQFQRPISMRVRFGSDPHWTHLDEPSVRLLLQLPSDADWRCVRQVVQLVRRFEYSVFEAGAVRGRGLRRPLSIAEQVVWELLNSRTLETDGVTVAVDWRSDRGMVLELVELVREDLMAEMLVCGMQLNSDEFMGRVIARSLAQARAEEAEAKTQLKK